MSRFESLDSAYEALLLAALSSNCAPAPRGYPTRELSNVLLTIENPRARFITNPARRWSLPLAFGELAWHLAGSQDVEALASYASIWRHYANGSKIYGSCYGHKIFETATFGKSQWDLCREALISDPSTRRAVIQLYDAEQNYPGSPDVSCVLNIQFVIRNGLLDATVLMRSNDVYFGFPYDVFFYSTLQELMAAEINQQLGAYHHFATSLHLYEKDVPKVEALLSNAHLQRSFSDLPLLRSAERHAFCRAEANIRAGRQEYKEMMPSDEFWRQKCLLLAEARGELAAEKSFYSQFLR